MRATGTRADDEGRASSGWAADSLGRSLRAGCMALIGAWQAVMIGAVLVSPDPSAAQRVVLVVAHLVVVGLVVATVRAGFPVWGLILVVDALLVADWAVAVSVDGVLSFATAWMADLTYLGPPLLLVGARKWLVAAVTIPVVTTGMYLAHHDWLHTLVLPSAVTGTAIFVVGSRSVPLLWSFASRVDAEITANDEARREVAAARAASTEGSDKARLLHDTVINTLAAIASGGGALRDAALVRDRCGRDASTLAALLDGDDVDAGPPGLDDVLAEAPLEVVRSGLDDVGYRAAVATVPDRVEVALRGIVREALQNVAKHAGVGRADVSVAQRDRTLVVVVSDAGHGFDGARLPGRGLDDSVFRRGEQAGIEVALTTAPGAGTSVSATVPLDAAPSEAPQAASFRSTTATLRGRGAWLWALGTGGVGITLEVVNRPGQFTQAYGMVAVVLLSTGVAWLDVRRHGALSLLGTAVLVLAAPGAFALALGGVDYGRHEVILWQCIGAAAPLVVLLVHARSRVPLITACVGIVVTSAVITVVVAQDSPTIAAVIPVGTAPALGVLGGWAYFVNALQRVGERAVAAQQQAAAARLETVEREAATRARGRWRHAGLRRSLDLLSSVADGTADPTGGDVRSSCAEEEAYLRQLIQLDPNVVHLGTHLAGALGLAHDRDVRLVVRTGDSDVATEDEASSLGTLVTGVVGAAGAGSRVTVSLFATRGSLRLGIVGPGDVLASSFENWNAPSGWDARSEAHGPAGSVEVVRSLTEKEVA